MRFSVKYKAAEDCNDGWMQVSCGFEKEGERRRGIWSF